MVQNPLNHRKHASNLANSKIYYQPQVFSLISEPSTGMNSQFVNFIFQVTPLRKPTSTTWAATRSTRAAYRDRMGGKLKIWMFLQKKMRANIPCWPANQKTADELKSCLSTLEVLYKRCFHVGVKGIIHSYRVPYSSWVEVCLCLCVEILILFFLSLLSMHCLAGFSNETLEKNTIKLNECIQLAACFFFSERTGRSWVSSISQRSFTPSHDNWNSSLAAATAVSSIY